jgi:hypothetical protein
MHDEDEEEALGMSPRQLTRLAAVHDESLEASIMSPAQLQKEAANRTRRMRESEPDALQRRAAHRQQSRGKSNAAMNAPMLCDGMVACFVYVVLAICIVISAPVAGLDNVEPHVIPERVDCQFCGAHLFPSEVDSTMVCCQLGKGILLPREPPPPGHPARRIHQLWQDLGDTGKLLRKHGRTLNSALSLASQT